LYHHHSIASGEHSQAGWRPKYHRLPFCKQAVKKTVDTFGKHDVFVNNAAFQQHANAITDISAKSLDARPRLACFVSFLCYVFTLPLALRGPMDQQDPTLREALDAMPHKVWMVRPHGPAIYYNRAMREFAGQKVLNLPDRSSRERALIHPMELPRVIILRDQAMAHPADWAVEVRFRSQHGEWRWHRLNFSMLWKDGEVDAWLATATDIHDLRAALQKAEESSELLQMAAEAAQLGIYSFDLETGQHEWSPELKAIFGFAPDAAEPPEVVGLVHAQDRDRFRSVRSKSFDPAGPGTFQDEHRILRTDGTERWVFVKGSVSFVGEGPDRKPKRGLGFVIDITERKAAETALKINEERYRSIVENANDVVSTLDLDFNFTSVNPAIRRVLGYAPDEIVGRNLSEFVPADQLGMHNAMRDRKLEGQEATQYEMQLLGKDGKKRFTLEVSSKLIFDTHGKPAGIHAIARDVSERKEAETRQSLLVRELQHRTKNMLAVIQSITTNTIDHSWSLKDARDAIIGRLHALAHAQEFVAQGARGGVPLQTLIEAELSTFAARATMEGEPIVVCGEFAQTFALLVHELATNAVKHGSLSVHQGRVAIAWKTDGADPILHFSWLERGGPPARTPTEQGLGSQLLAAVGQSEMAFTDKGYEYSLQVPLAEVVGRERDAA
jgi:PAS domain S-box-containing protein